MGADETRWVGMRKERDGEMSVAAATRRGGRRGEGDRWENAFARDRERGRDGIDASGRGEGGGEGGGG